MNDMQVDQDADVIDELARQDEINDELMAAVAQSMGRYVALMVSPELHTKLLSFAFDVGLDQLMDLNGRIAGNSLEGAATAILLARCFSVGPDAAVEQ